jgi:hypothetical protein
MRRLMTATLTERDWVRVVHAINSSLTRKAKRGDIRGADEMKLIGVSLVRQCGLQRADEKQKGRGR